MSSLPYQVPIYSKFNSAKVVLGQGGIAAVGQLQFLQPFFGFALAAALLKESVSWSMLVVTIGVVACVAGARKFAH